MKSLLWQFRTQCYTVRLWCEPEMNPDLSWDDDGEARRMIESGELGNFTFSVTLDYKGKTIARDYLGNSVYADPREFRLSNLGIRAYSRQHYGDSFASGTYFHDMVQTVIKEARKAAA